MTTMTMTLPVYTWAEYHSEFHPHMDLDDPRITAGAAADTAKVARAAAFYDCEGDGVRFPAAVWAVALP